MLFDSLTPGIVGAECIVGSLAEAAAGPMAGGGPLAGGGATGVTCRGPLAAEGATGLVAEVEVAEVPGQARAADADC